MENPYRKPGVASTDLHALHTRVSYDDIHYLKKLLPGNWGVQDRLLATLFHKFIAELRAQNLSFDDDVVWNVAHPQHVRINLILERCNFRGPSDNNDPA